jgi:hypothetical protein
MPLTLEQYATQLDARGLPWPATPKVKSHLKPLPGIRAVVWNVYGTLLSIAEGDLKFETATDFQLGIALEKTIHEFKMWASMSRKPGQPSEYMREIYRKVLDEQKLAPSVGEKYPELLAEKVWESIIKKLQQKEYKYDAGIYGPMPEYCKKIAYFFHASLQGTGCYEGAASAMRGLYATGIVQGLMGDGQCFTPAQLGKHLANQDPAAILDEMVGPNDRILSHAYRARKPSDTLFGAAIEAMGKRGIEPSEILHIGSSLTRDVGPAKKWGMKTALFAGDRLSLSATSEQLKDPLYRPDRLLTELSQTPQLIG